MTDGTTGIQVAPITEDDMSRVQDILKRAIDAVVGMSQLQTDVDGLRNTVSQLQADTDRLRTQNAGLDEALYQSRQARNDLTTKLQGANHDLTEAVQARDSFKHDAEVLQAHVYTLQGSLHVVEQARDEAELKAMQLEDDLKAAQAKLAQIEEGFNSIFNRAKPEAVQVPIREAQPEPERADSPEPSQPEPHSPPPTPPEPVSATSFPITSDEWKPGYSWDNARGVYVKSDTASI